ncbi:hypothetical protein [Bifidobacterium moraviense]|nr:hypothetical protein [Bifidobacterium sp. DSM 109958]
MTALASCSPAAWMPRVEGRLEAELAPDSCERLLAQAEDARDAANAPVSAARTDAGRIGAGNLTRWQRLAGAESARALWRQVAVSCPGRFAEGVLSSAQMDRRAVALADAAHTHYVSAADGGTVIDESTKLVIASDVAGTMATAQDRAAFAYEILASRHRADSSALLTLSERHRTLAAGFAARTKDDDARRKVYSVQQLIASPDAVADAATGLRVPTVSAVAMDLVREQLADLTDDDGSDATIIADESTARTLADLLAEEASKALELGFPSFDAALFATRVDES